MKAGMSTERITQTKQQAQDRRQARITLAEYESQAEWAAMQNQENQKLRLQLGYADETIRNLQQYIEGLERAFDYIRELENK